MSDEKIYGLYDCLHPLNRWRFLVNPNDRSQPPRLQQLWLGMPQSEEVWGDVQMVADLQAYLKAPVY